MDELNTWNPPQHDSDASGEPAGTTQRLPVPTGQQDSAGTRRRSILRWTAGIVAAAVVAVGGAVTGLTLAHTSGQSGQAAVLNAALSGSSGAVASGTPGQHAAAHPRRVARVLRHLRGLHGEFTVRKRGGGFREIAFERGTVTAASSKDVTVHAADGTTWTWTITGDTIVVKNRARSSSSSLAAGEQVFVGGPQQGGVRGARLILIRARQSGSRNGRGSASAPAAPSSSAT